MNKNRRNLLCAGMCILALTGCSAGSSASSNTTADTTTAQTKTQTETQAEGQQPKGQAPADAGIMAKISSVQDASITVTLADTQEQPDGSNPPAGNQDNTSTPPEKPAGDSPNTGSADAENQKPETTFNGETKTYTLSSSVSITKGMEQESGSLSDLNADTVVSLTLDGDTVTAINIMN